MKILAVIATKGGVGKSTTCFHLAHYLSSHGSVVLVDGDDNLSCSSWADRSPSETPFNVVGLAEASKQQGDFLIFDSQIKFHEIDAIAKESSLILVPTTTSALSVQAAANVSDRLQELHSNYRLVLQMVDPRSKATATKAADSLNQLGYPLLKSWIRSYSAYEAAALAALPVNRISNQYSGVAWSDYKSLGAEILKILNDV